MSGAQGESFFLSFVLPVKDGEARLAETLDEIVDLVANEARPCEIIVVDDGSSDRTPEILAEYQSRCAFLKVLTHAQNRGKGAALRTGAGASSGRYVLTMDSDASFGLEAVRGCVEALERGADGALGNRRDAGTNFVLRPRDFAYIGVRHLMGWAFNRVARVVTGIHVQDSQCGFKCFRGDVARELFPEVDADRFAFDVELTALLELRGSRLAEVPVVYRYREQASTVRLFRDGLQMLGELRRIRAKVRRLRRSGKFADHRRGDYQYLALREGNPVQRFWHQQKWPLVYESLSPTSGERILDIGPGSSDIPLQLARTGAHTCALDPSLASLQHSHRRAREEPELCALFAAGDVHHLPFPDASFDKAVVLEVFEHLPAEGIPQYLAQIRRTLRSGATLLVTTPNYRSYWPVLELLIDHLGGAAEMGGKQHITRFHARRLRRALEESGFEVVRQGSVYHLSPFLAPVAPKLALRLFAWEMRQGRSAGPILFALARPRAE